MSDLKNPMRFSIKNRSIDIENYLRHPDHTVKQVTKIEVRPSEGNVYVHWEECDHRLADAEPTHIPDDAPRDDNNDPAEL